MSRSLLSRARSRACLLVSLVAMLPSWSAAADDPCRGLTHCYNAGSFIAEIVQVLPSSVTARARHQTLTLNLRFRNVSAQPVILGYRAKSSAGLDNFGNQYYWGRAGTYDTSVKGIGIVDGRKADTQFALRPGQSRNATFTVVRYDAKPPLGTAYNYELVIDELELLPGEQVRTIRENSLSFTNLSANLPQAGRPAAKPDSAPSAEEVVDALKTLLGGKKTP